MAALQDKHIASLDKILGREISGMFFLRGELQEFMDANEVTELIKRLDPLYELGKVKNHGRSYNPKYRAHRLVDADTVKPKVVFQVILPGNGVHKAEVVGELLLAVKLEEHGGVVLALSEETEAEKLARVNNWKAGEAELKALDALIEAARTLEKFGGRSFPVQLSVGSDGVQLSAKYADPMKAVRAVLAG